MRFRLRTLLIVGAIGPPLMAGVLLYGERTWNEVRRWWIRQQPARKAPVNPTSPQPASADNLSTAEPNP